MVSRLISFAAIDEVNNSLFWPYTKEETEGSKPTYLLPTAYAVHTLAQLGSYRDHLPGAVKYLVHQLNNHLNGLHKLHMHELVHLLLALASVQETERNRHISKSDIRKAEYFLYQYVLQHNYFDATYINFTVSKPKFESLFYVIKTNLTILKYFLQFESIYIRTSDIHRQIWNLVHLVRTDGKFIDAANNRSAVRENALALRAIHLFVEKYRDTRRLGVKWYYSVFFRFLQWSPARKVRATLVRLLLLTLILIVPIASLFSTDKPGTMIIAVCTGILGTFLYEQLRRPW